jgi:hypothetical protein
MYISRAQHVRVQCNVSTQWEPNSVRLDSIEHDLTLNIRYVTVSRLRELKANVRDIICSSVRIR